jgi:RsiW-degrading membrane proteinase PrsW (M82 family)
MDYQKIIPVLLVFLLTFFFYLSHSERAPKRLAAKTFFLGFIFAFFERFIFRYFFLKLMPIHDLRIFTAVLNNDHLNLTLVPTLLTIVVVNGFTQEVSKMCSFELMTYGYDNQIEHPWDYLVYSVMTGMGFAAFNLAVTSGEALRTISGCVFKCIELLASIISAGIVGGKYAEYKFGDKFKKKSRWGCLLRGFLWASSLQIAIRLCFTSKEKLIPWLIILVAICLCILTVHVFHRISQLSPLKYKT